MSLKRSYQSDLRETVKRVENVIKKAQVKIGNPDDFYVFRVIFHSSVSSGHYCETRWMMADDGSKKGRFIRSLEGGELVEGVRGGMEPWLLSDDGAEAEEEFTEPTNITAQENAIIEAEVDVFLKRELAPDRHQCIRWLRSGFPDIDKERRKSLASLVERRVKKAREAIGE